VRRLLGRELRLLSHVLIVGALVSGVDFALRAWLPALHAQLAIFVPLIATNCVILSRVERCASGAARALRDALAHAAALLPAFVLFGALRELIGHGTLLAGMDALAGGDGSSAGLEVFDGGFLLVGLTPGAFLVLAGFAALHRRLAARPALPGAAAPAAAAG
jgi:electron transport complex protein RnfE